jgi:hypothetical protein
MIRTSAPIRANQNARVGGVSVVGGRFQATQDECRHGQDRQQDDKYRSKRLKVHFGPAALTFLSRIPPDRRPGV